MIRDALHPLSLREAIADQVAQWLVEHVGRQSNLCSDSRRVRPGDGFIARAGRQSSAEMYIDQAIAAGASAIVVDGGDGLTAMEAIPSRIPMIRVPRLTSRVGMIASAFYGRPSMVLQVLAVTGTNGKSTVAAALAYALARSGIAAAAIGTLGLAVFPAHCDAGFTPTWDDQITGGLTTPDPVDVQRILHDLKGRGVSAVVIEASSIGLVQGRLQGCAIKVAAFTNLSHDHLDVHGTMEAYAQAKALLFAAPSLGAMVVNTDDPHALTMWQAHDANIDRIAVGGQAPKNAHVHLRVVRASPSLSGWDLTLTGTGDAFDLSGDLHLPVLGRHNVDNAMVVAGCLLAMSLDSSVVRERLGEFMLPPGRLQMVSRPQGPWACIDYAHSPDALARVLESLAPLAQARRGRLVCIFGCGGDRDAAKRPVMGRVAAEHADLVVLTSDNPRTESPEMILDAIEAGVPASLREKVVRQSDRALAIAQTIARAQAQDVVVIAGKGHEQTQTIGSREILFSDADHVARAIDGWSAARAVDGVAHA